MKNGILVRKLAEMEETMRRLRGYLPSSYEEFAKDWGRQKIVERALQILIEAMVDIGERFIALADGPPCETSASVMERLQDLGAGRVALPRQRRFHASSERRSSRRPSRLATG